MSIGRLWKEFAERIAAGERDEAAMVAEAKKRILASRPLTINVVTQLAAKRIRDMIAGAVKPTGVTSRVPAGQESFGWLDLEPTFAVERLKRQVRLAYAAMSRAAVHAQVLGILDASQLEASDFETFGEMLRAANVPDELVTALAA